MFSELDSEKIIPLHSRVFYLLFIPTATTLSEEKEMRPVTAKSVMAVSYLLAVL